jgi:hypothetical protein
VQRGDAECKTLAEELAQSKQLETETKEAGAKQLYDERKSNEAAKHQLAQTIAALEAQIKELRTTLAKLRQDEVHAFSLLLLGAAYE